MGFRLPVRLNVFLVCFGSLEGTISIRADRWGCHSYRVGCCSGDKLMGEFSFMRCVVDLSAIKIDEEAEELMRYLSMGTSLFGIGVE